MRVMNNNMTDMTIGSPTRHILLFALPTLIGNIFQQVYNLADSMIVGKFSGVTAWIRYRVYFGSKVAVADGSVRIIHARRKEHTAA